MASLFTCITIFTCEGRNGGVHGEFLVGKCGPGKCSGIDREGDGFMEMRIIGWRSEGSHENLWSHL